MKAHYIFLLVFLGLPSLYGADGRPKRLSLKIDTCFEELDVSIPDGFTEDDCTRAARGITSQLSRLRYALENDGVRKDLTFWQNFECALSECAAFLTRPGIKDLYNACNEAKEKGYESDLQNLDFLKAEFLGVTAVPSRVDTSDEESSVQSSEDQGEPRERQAGKKRSRRKHAHGRGSKAARKEKSKHRKKEDEEE